jgi:hypothetical protein
MDPSPVIAGSTFACLRRSTPITATAAGLRKRVASCLKFVVAVLCLLSAYYFTWKIVPAALGERAPTVQQGLFPEWLGAREVLHGRSPYRREVTDRIQITVYGTTLPAGQRNQQRFAYPVYLALLFLPLALLPFSAAQYLCLAGCLALTILSVKLWAPGRDLARGNLVVAIVCVLSTYPAILGLQLCQPSLVIAGLLAVVFYWVRAERLVWAGLLAGLCTSKPQLAIAVLLPLSMWSLAGWRARKPFLLALCGSTGALLLASEIVVPGWFGQWLTTIRAYSQYAGSEPLLAELLHGHVVWPATVLLVAACVWVSHKFCESDLLFAISFSIAVFQLIFPFLLYNEILLVPAALWLMRSPAAARGGWPGLRAVLELFLGATGLGCGRHVGAHRIEPDCPRLRPQAVAISIRSGVALSVVGVAGPGRVCTFAADYSR